MDFSTLSDEQLSQMLTDYGVDVGPINVATRSTYERKLSKLKSGQISPPSHTYDPVDDDDDYEVELRLPATSTPSSRGGNPIASPPPSAIPVPRSAPTPAYSPATSQVRSRREVLDHSAIPRVEGRPNLSSGRRVTSPIDTASKAAAPESSGIPMWVKLLVLLVVASLCYLIYSNMEESVTSNIPHLPDKVEV